MHCPSTPGTLLFGVVGCLVTMAACADDKGPKLPMDIPSSQTEILDDVGVKRFRWKSVCDSKTKRLIRLGTRRIAVEVTAYDPPSKGNSSIVVELINAKVGGQNEIGRFGLNPDASFQATDAVEPHRFQFSLREYSELLDSDEIQIEVYLDASDKSDNKGKLEVTVHWLDL